MVLLSGLTATTGLSSKLRARNAKQEGHALQQASLIYECWQEEDGQGVCQWQGKDYSLWCKGLRSQLQSCGA
jgi:hypothetical protein